MNKKKIKLSILFLLFPFFLFSQITPDSLIGTYAGERWFKWEEDTEWTITNDTVYITSVNGNNCLMISIANHPWIWYKRFYANDSLKIIYEDVSPPPPNDHASSTRFFSKKISSDILIHTETLKKGDLSFYPNPFNKQLTIRMNLQENVKNHFLLKIFDVNGNEIKIEYRLSNNQILINTESLTSGLYTLQIIQNNSIKSYKVIKI